MANTYGYQFRSAKEPAVWDLFGKVTIGAAGAPTLVAASSRGITSITRNSAGRYTIVLAETWNKFLGMHVTIQLAAGIPASPVFHVVSETVATAATKNIVIEFDSAAGGAATDPDSGTVLYLQITLKNSSV
jgi:hypothetical protein